jgi:hypothetical protein
VNEIQRLIEEQKLVIAMTEKAAEVQKFGSYSERNPLLGKMRTCPYCKIRERNHQCRAKFKVEFIPKVRP